MKNEEQHIVAMTKDEFESYMEGEFQDTDLKNQRAFATIMVMMSDYQEFIVGQDLWDQFVDSLDGEYQEIH